VSPNRPKHAADDTRPTNAMFASFVNMCAIFKIAIAIMKSSTSSAAPYQPICSEVQQNGGPS